MSRYDEGHADGYRVGPYGVAPDGSWGGGYNTDKIVADTSGDYRRGLSEGRKDRINDMGNAIYDPIARNREAVDAYRRANREEKT